MWLFFGGFVVPSAKAKPETEAVNNKAKAMTKAFFILASFKVVKK